MQTNFNYNPVAGQPIVNQALGQAQQLYAKFTQDVRFHLAHLSHSPESRPSLSIRTRSNLNHSH